MLEQVAASLGAGGLDGSDTRGAKMKIIAERVANLAQLAVERLELSVQGVHHGFRGGASRRRRIGDWRFGQVVEGCEVEGAWLRWTFLRVGRELSGPCLQG